MKINKIHCLFEQSGTFKNEFKKLGFCAYDYDILNDFKETDFQIDLFNEIEKAYSNEKSIFDNIKLNDLIMAFFPCIRFETQIKLNFRGDNYGQRKWSDIQKLEYDLKLHEELNHFYNLITKLTLICLKKGLRLIIENPYSSQHYLTNYWGIRPKLIDENRRLRGDYYEKPTQYRFINCEPSNNFIFEGIDLPISQFVIDKSTVERSLISKQYANRFIREFIIDEVKK